MGAPDDGSAQSPTMQQHDQEQQLHEESLVIMADKVHRVYTPPAHIAARFNRAPITQRRKSSATSSRRNSLSSSVHSHGSGLSQRRSSTPAGIQSHSVAQHLRRASILETRKSRLADRAAHAEQVRLRAALAKAAPRGSISASEEKALAAQIAKEKYLAKVAAACAEEVARAKRIAEEVKERKLADETRARLEMEERHAEAEKRRSEYQRNLQDRRARRADSAEKKLAVVEEDVSVEAAEEAIVDDLEQLAVMDEETAARKIQKAWRLTGRRAVLNEFLKLNINKERIANDDFDELTLFVANPKVISATTGLLTQLGLQQPNDENAPLNTRTFLSAYMLAGHPAAVLNNRNGAQEQDLIAKAKDLTAGFEFTLERLAAWNAYSPHPNQQETLSQSYTAYTSAFAAWRVQDSSVLIEGMVASFVELDAIWQMVKDDSRGDVASDYRQGIRDNQVKLLSRIQKLAGRERADALIKKAIRESRRRRPKKRAVAEVRPRGVEAGPESEAMVQQDEDDVPASPISEQEEPSQRSGQLSRLFTTMPSNRVLTHELAVDKDFKLEEDEANAELRDRAYRSICENMKLAFEMGQGAVWTVSAAENLREKLLRMLKPGNSMYNLINETLDLDQISQQCQAGIFSYDGFFNFMAGILPKLCAPYRDAEVKKLADELQGSAAIEGVGDDELSIMIEKLFRLLRMVDSLSLDYSNFMLMNAAPTLIREAPGYEKRHFAADLESGRIGLERTRSFWRNAESLLVAEADRRDPEGIRRPEDRPSATKIYAKALVDLAISPSALSNEDVPETLALDTARLRRFRNEALRIAVIGALFLTAKNLLRRDVRSQWKTEASRLWQLLATESYTSPSPASEDQARSPSPAEKATSILASAHNMPPATKSHLAATAARFFAQAASSRLSDPVLKVLFQRLKSHVFSRLAAVTSAERVRAASSAQETLAGCGLAEFVSHVGALVEGLEKVRTVDLAGHGVWYEWLAREEDDGEGVMRE